MKRILIVDDAAAIRDSMARVLQHEGYETECARNGAEGLERLKQRPPDLVLLDLMMPGVDGLTFLAGMRRFPKWRNLPVIMMSGVSDRGHIMQAQALGVRDYLVKASFSIDDLLQHVQKHIGNAPQVQ